MADDPNKSDQAPEPDDYMTDDSDSWGIDLEDRVITILLTVGMPFIIGFIAFGVIILAYSQWKLY